MLLYAPEPEGDPVPRPDSELLYYLEWPIGGGPTVTFNRYVLYSEFWGYPDEP